MSRAIASARQRRAGIATEASIPPPPPPTQQGQNGLTLPQVISLVDARLVKLEKFMKEHSDMPTENNVQVLSSSSSGAEISPELLDEFQTRFDILAQEINQLKDIVLKLQSYTMDVNKQLLEERDLLQQDNDAVFTMQHVDILKENELESVDLLTENNES